jgi:SAM-dependent methyltransferase
VIVKQGQVDIDRANVDFWSELCGSGLAHQLGLMGDEPDALERFDTAYFALYPYLKSYVDRHAIRDKDLLEVGLGYGSLGQYLAENGCTYHGVDIARPPVEMMRHRLQRLGSEVNGTATVASALDLPFQDASFDYVFSIGCLHHTGDISRALAQVSRVLRPGGTAVLMLYNRHSLRQFLAARRVRFRAMVSRRSAKDAVRALYDSNSAGSAAPHTDFVSRRDVIRLLPGFETVEIRAENSSPLTFRRWTLLSRDRLLASPLPRLLGLDLYITAAKRGAANVGRATPSTNEAGT